MRKDSREDGARVQECVWRARIASDLADFIEAQTSFFLATFNAEGRPCIEQYDGPTGFLNMLDDGTLGFPDFVGDHYVTRANLAIEPRAHIFLIDYAHRRCITIRGKGRVVENDAELAAKLTPRAERTILFGISAWDPDCPFAQRPEAVDSVRANAAESASRYSRTAAAFLDSQCCPKPNGLSKIEFGHFAIAQREKIVATADRAKYDNGGPAYASPAPAGGDFLSRLRSGDKKAFRALVQKHQASLARFAQTFVGNRATAEEVVQDTWLAVVEGLPAFEGRSSLKNWIFAILANKARSRAVRDKRLVTAGIPTGDIDEDGPAIGSFGFDTSREWTAPLASWDDVTPERVVSSRQILAHVKQAIDILPPAQRRVMLLRQVNQMTSHEVQELLGISAANQRVLLHRARAKVREYVERPLHRELGTRLPTPI